MYKKLIILFFTFFSIELHCQQIMNFSQSVFNNYIFNPAHAGTDSMVVLDASYRQLWSGVNDAPKEELISVHFPFSEKIGVGSKLFKTETGPITKTAFEATYAYKVPLNFYDFKLSLGLSALIYEYALDKEKIKMEDMSDEALTQSNNNLIVPDANFGVSLYKEKIYFGFAVHQLFNRKVSLMNHDNLSQKQVRHYFINAGYRYNIHSDFEIEPYTLIKILESGIVQADINLLCSYKKMLSFGLAYRTKNSILLLISAKKNKISVGYSYDLTFGAISKFSSGSHEIRLTYRFKSESYQK